MDINNLFAGFETKDSYAILFIMLIAFLLGLLVAWLLRSAAVRRQRRLAQEAHEKTTQLEAQLTSAQALLQERNRELQEESREKVDLLDQLQRQEAEKSSRYHEVYQLNQEIEQLKSANRAALATIDQLHEQIHTLQAAAPLPLQAAIQTNVEQTEAPPSTTVTPEDYDRLAGVEARLEQLAHENQLLRLDLAQLSARDLQTTEMDLAAMAAKLNELAAENEALRQDMQRIQTAEPNTVVAPQSTFAEPTEPTLSLVSDKSVLHERLDTAPGLDNADDLTRIEGIGPFLAGKLQEIGVVSFAEIASWDAARIATITQLIGYLPGRIEKDDWVGQAQRLLEAPTDNNEPATTPPPPPAPDDLKLIEGIGPKIEELLQQAGIHTWRELAAADPGRLREILDEGGEQFRIHSPYTWPLQARLAAANRWDELRAYQDELKGGREV